MEIYSILLSKLSILISGQHQCRVNYYTLIDSRDFPSYSHGLRITSAFLLQLSGEWKIYHTDSFWVDCIQAILKLFSLKVGVFLVESDCFVSISSRLNNVTVMSIEKFSIKLNYLSIQSYRTGSFIHPNTSCEFNTEMLLIWLRIRNKYIRVGFFRKKQTWPCS